MGARSAGGSSSGTSGSRCVVVVDDSSVTRGTSAIVVTMLLTDLRNFIVVSNVKTKDCRINVAMTDDQHSTKDWLGKNVENAIEDSLRIR